MPQPRNRQLSLETTPYYHCISRCVRRAFLCGKDSHTGFNFEHRRQWIVDRIQLLCGVFSVDLCAYAIMHNHYHIVVRIDVEQLQGWSDEEIARRWLRIISGPLLMTQYLGGVNLTRPELETVHDLLAAWRHRLCDLSWSVERGHPQLFCYSGKFWMSSILPLKPKGSRWVERMNSTGLVGCAKSSARRPLNPLHRVF